MTVPYIYYINEYLDSIIVLLINHIIELRINTFSTFNIEIIDKIKKYHKLYFKLKIKTKVSLITNELNSNDLENINLQEGDGDFVFVAP